LAARDGYTAWSLRYDIGHVVETTVRIILLVIVCVLAGCSPGGRSGERSGGRKTAETPGNAISTPPLTPSGGRMPSPPENGIGAHRVTFAIRGGVRRAWVTYALSGGPKRRAVVSPPWSRTFTVADGEDVEVTARSGDDGELTCTLSVDGDLVKSASSSGDSAVVDCGDRLGF
jgi:hypothetical protein